MKKLIVVCLGLIILLVLGGCASKTTVSGLTYGFRESTPSAPGSSSAGTSNQPAPTIMVNVPPAARHEYGLDKPSIAGLFDGFKGDEVTPGLQYLTPEGDYEGQITSTTGSPAGVSWNSQSLNAGVPADVRMIVRTGNLRMVVDEITAALNGIKQIANRYEGYIVNLQQWKEGDRNIGAISIRVNASEYENAMNELRSLAKSVTSETSTSLDVTEEYTDLNAQLSNFMLTESQLQKIMETAVKTEDILSIQRELTTVRGQIESTRGRMQYLERTSATSLIDIQLEEAVLALKFNADKISAGTQDPIAFTAEISGGFEPYSYFWDFGDGHTSFDRAPVHSYKYPGSYPVGLKITDDKGYTNTVVRNAYINIISSWKPGSVARNAWSGFVTFAKGLVNGLIWVAAFSPLWITAGVLVWYFVFYRRRKKNPF